MKSTMLFDLGGTLVRYYERSEFPGILEQAMLGIRDHLRHEDLLRVSPEAMWQRVQVEDYEASDYRVRPLEERLTRIFQLEAPSRFLLMAICRHFMKPIFTRGCCYEDTPPALRRLKSEGVKMAIISNTPWGSPSALWREEIGRLGLSEWMDIVVFCTDVGWRKPARQIFDFTLEKLHIRPQDCIFIGDHPRWDLAGARAVGIEAILMDRQGAIQDAGEVPVKDLHELADRLHQAS